MNDQSNVDNQPVDIGKAILSKIKEIETLKKAYRTCLGETIEADSNYDRALALVIVKLRNGKELDLDGEKIKDPPATAIKEIAKGLCWKERLECSKAKARLDGVKSSLNSTEAQLNGYQSINRHLGEL